MDQASEVPLGSKAVTKASDAPEYVASPTPGVTGKLGDEVSPTT